MVKEPELDPVQAPFFEAGITGLTRYGGISRVYEEFLKELQGPSGMKLLREQIDNCPITGAFLFAAEHLARSADYRVVPARATDQQTADRVAERIRGALFDDMDRSWPDQLSEILSFLGFGWSNFEMVFKKCRGQSAADLTTPPLLAGPRGQGPEAEEFTPSKYDDGFIGFKKWSLRAQETIFMWEWDDQSNPIVMQQLAPPDFKIRRIPLSKCLLFRTSIKKNNPEGRSLLRNSVVSYLFRKGIQQTEAIGIERDLAGYPTFSIVSPKEAEGKSVPDLWNTKDPNAASLLAKIQLLARSIRRDEQEGLVLPWWLKFDLKTSGGRRNFDTNAIITRYDQRIAMSVLADFVMIGHQSQGSKALVSHKGQLFTTALDSFLTNIDAIINRFAIPLLCELNGIPLEYAPKIEHGNVEIVDLDTLGKFIQSLSGAGMEVFPPGTSADLQQALLRAANLPDTSIENPREEMQGDAFTDPDEEGPAADDDPAGALEIANRLSVGKRRYVVKRDEYGRVAEVVEA